MFEYGSRDIVEHEGEGIGRDPYPCEEADKPETASKCALTWIDGEARLAIRTDATYLIIQGTWLASRGSAASEASISWAVFR